jgi:hypothetical protein
MKDQVVWLPCKVTEVAEKTITVTNHLGVQIHLPVGGFQAEPKARLYFCPGQQPPWSTDPTCGQ